jgi:hypothetical protein
MAQANIKQNSIEDNLVWHYTTKEHAISIAKMGLLKVTKPPGCPDKAELWFSKQQFWEPTASKMVNKDGIWAATLGGEFAMNIQVAYSGIYRFGIKYPNSNLMSWSKYKKAGNKTEFEIFLLETTGIEVGSNPKNWLVSLNNISISEVSKIECFNGKTYEFISLKNLQSLRI